MQKSLDIFKAEPQSVFDVLCSKSNTGFYMPAYQRSYSWEEHHIKDLFSDCENVFRNLLTSPDAIIFLGSILSVDDSSAQTVYPLIKGHKPTNIKLIIDGQQRLTTLTIVLMCINERLRLHLPKLKRSIENEDNETLLCALENLREIVAQIILDTSSFVIETTADHSLYKYYPKIIRSQIDCWGKDEKNAKYDSPISDLLISYQRYIVESTNSLSFKEFNLSKLKDSSKRVANNVKEIRRQLNCIESGFLFDNVDSDSSEILSVSKFLDVETLDVCLDFPVDKDLLEASKRSPGVDSIIFLAVFAKFLLHRVCLTYVEVNNESYAFDMFEALNTTGEPLTAIETFVPKVIEHIGNKRRFGEENADEMMSVLCSITERFENIIKSDLKNEKTKSLILVFIRAYQGEVRVTKLRDQRDSMLKSFEQCAYIYKDDYLNQLAKTANFLFDNWQGILPNVDNLVALEDRDIANVCLRYLVDMNHEIVQALLVQFMLQDEKYKFTQTESSTFFKILKAVTAFSVLWRAMSGAADGIDAVYKKLHEKGLNVNGIMTKPYQLKGSLLSLDEFSFEDVKAYFRHELGNKIIIKESPKDSTFEKWLDICSKQPLLTKPKSIKLLILAGFHGIKLDGEKNYFIRSDEPKTNFLTPMMWELISNKDRVKKVYNGSSVLDWADSAIKNPEQFNKLGNVFVDARNSIPTDEKQSWYNIKQAMLEANNNDSLAEIDMILTSTSTVSDEVRRNSSVHLLESKYIDITYADEWNKQAIDERTELLLKNAWENLYQWLC